jgi:hypothetical protein
MEMLKYKSNHHYMSFVGINYQHALDFKKHYPNSLEKILQEIGHSWGISHTYTNPFYNNLSEFIFIIKKRKNTMIANLLKIIESYNFIFLKLFENSNIDYREPLIPTDNEISEFTRKTSPPKFIF